MKNNEQRIEELENEVKELKQHLLKAIKFLKASKLKFAPKTTNSQVDDFLKLITKKGL
jgi:hypothetical protein